MNRLRDIVPARHRLEGEKVSIDSVLNIPLEFLDWDIRPSVKQKDSDYMIMQFRKDGKLHVIMTGGEYLIKDVRSYEESAGKEPFLATIVKKGNAYLFA